MTFVKEFRIEYASKLVRDTSLPINEVAFESGYENLSNFYRQFAEIKGLTPVQYRRKHLDYRKTA